MRSRESFDLLEPGPAQDVGIPVKDRPEDRHPIEERPLDDDEAMSDQGPGERRARWNAEQGPAGEAAEEGRDLDIEPSRQLGIRLDQGQGGLAVLCKAPI